MKNTLRIQVIFQQNLDSLYLEHRISAAERNF